MLTFNPQLLSMQIGLDIDKYPSFDCDLDMAEQMVKEQSVFVLPGKVRAYFHKDNVTLQEK